MKKRYLALASAALLAVAAGAAYAAIPGSSGTISACKDNKGVLRVIDAEAGQSCGSNQQLLTWNQQGPAGPQGEPGVSGYQIVYAEVETAVASASHLVADALCPAGKVPIGGGGRVDDLETDGLAFIADSHPFANGWRVRAARNEETQQYFRLAAYAVCVTVG